MLLQRDVCRAISGIRRAALVIHLAVKMFVPAIKFKTKRLANVPALSQLNARRATFGTYRHAHVLRITNVQISDGLDQFIQFTIY